MRLRWQFLFTALCCFLVMSHGALAQNVPSSAEPSRTGGQIAPMPMSALPSISALAPAAKIATAPQGAGQIKFTLQAVTIEGQTVYDRAVVALLYKNLIGKEVTLSDVFGIADSLTAKYRNDGYILTQVVVPPQTIEGGHVVLRVIEGFVDKVTIQGETRHNTAWLRGFADKIKASKPLNSKVLERYVLLINDLPGMTARSVLSQSKTPGASDITIIVSQKAYDAFFETDNRGTRFIGPLQVNLGARLNNALGHYEGLNFQAVTAPDTWSDEDPEMLYFSFNWQQPLNHEGTKLTVGGSFTETHPEFTLTPFDIDGIAKSINVELSHPFIRSRNLNLYGGVKFNYLNTSRNDNLGLGPVTDRLRVLRAGSTVQFSDRLLGVNTVSAELSKGLGIFNATGFNDTSKTRALGDPLFFKGTAEASRIQPLTPHLEAFVSVTGQLSADTLLASEEFGVGGANYGSAYDASEITGEDGYAGRFELRVNNPVQLPVNLLQLYGFYDGGWVNDPDNAVVKARTRSIASAGGGMRVNVNEHFMGTLEIAVPLTAQVATVLDNAPRVFATLTAKF